MIMAVAVTNFAFSTQWSRALHYVHEVMNNSGYTPLGQRVVEPPRWAILFTPLQIGALVLFMLWLYRAASTAAALRYPARRSPALGAWSCIIPVVNLWFPYQAIRDCFDPRDRSRTLVLRAWMLFIVTQLIAESSTFVFAEARSLATPWLVILIGLATLLGVTGYRMVVAVSTAHHDALDQA
jgi:hypothetical protein